jgi:hypothetical protein
MKPVNKNAAYIQDVRLRENKPWYRSPADAERNCRRFWKRQASKMLRKDVLPQQAHIRTGWYDLFEPVEYSRYELFDIWEE